MSNVKPVLDISQNGLDIDFSKINRDTLTPMGIKVNELMLQYIQAATVAEKAKDQIRTEIHRAYPNAEALLKRCSPLNLLVLC